MLKIDLKQILINSHILESEDEWFSLNAIAQETGETILFVINKVKKIPFIELALKIAEQSSLGYFDLDSLNESVLDIEGLRNSDIEIDRTLFIEKNAKELIIAVSDPSIVSVSSLKFKEKVSRVSVLIVEDDKLTKFIEDLLRKNEAENHGKNKKIIEEMMQDLAETSILQEDSADVDDAPVVRFINGMMNDAVRMKASDVHLEPYEDTYRVRFRVDGDLFEVRKVPVQLKSRLASRVKVISNMDISEKRKPQDGRFKLRFSAKKLIDIRVSSLPTMWGEKIVMRILDSDNTALDINTLGYTDKQKQIILDAIRKPYGMILVTGPTGSGKTVSLYSCINILNEEGVNICTVEDPVEINLRGVNQVNINPRAGLTFDVALLAFLRQDPDIILVGEIRDRLTADTAIKAAQTGHLLLSTIHTNDAPKTITRLIQMGVEPYNIASSILLITSQRLIKKLCNHCKEVEVLPKDVLKRVGFNQEDLDTYGEWVSYKPVGCEMCMNTGFSGREGIYQVMPISENIKNIILSSGTDLEIEREARRMGVENLRESGLNKVKLGITSLSEVLSTTSDS